MFRCTAGVLRRRVAFKFGLERSQATCPDGRTVASRLLLAWRQVVTGRPLEEELCGRRSVQLLMLVEEDTLAFQVYRILRDLPNHVFCTGINWYVHVLWRFMVVYSCILNFPLKILYT
jgi:hypothetical protein